jgi:hypothetical protein
MNMLHQLFTSCVSDGSQHSDVCHQGDTKCRQPNIVQTGHLQYGVCYQGNNVLRRLEGTNLLNCVKECMMTSNCTSINYRTNWRTEVHNTFKSHCAIYLKGIDE